jgi:glycosyltransferase involved in cell wall biosynthesis
LEEQKNIKNLILAASDLNLELDIYGDGSQRKELEQLVLSLHAKVSFKGKVKNALMPDILREYNFYILPSLYEGMPKTLIEAMGCGLICIGTDTLGIREVIQNKYNGFLIHGFTHQEIKECLENSLNYMDYETITSNGLSTVHEKFSLTSYTNNEFQIFQKLINE